MGLFQHRPCVCGKNRATIKVTKIGEDGSLEELWVCSECAAEMSPLQQRPEGEVADLQAFLEILKGKAEAAAKPGDVPASESEIEPCPSCGMTFEHYRKTFLLGCADCYEAFADALTTDLRKIHGATRHVGAAPTGLAAETVERVMTVSDLKRQLRRAVEAEDFEEAARLRDEIRRLEESGSGE